MVESDSGTTSMSFAVAMSNRSDETITVPYTTNAGTATSSDYVARSGTMTFHPGEITKTLGVAIKGDTIPEATETFTLSLGTPTNATIADATGIGTITDND
jgi:hypothetical protein